MKTMSEQDNRKAIGQRLALLRVSLGIKQKDIYTAIGAEQVSYSHWEKGRTLPNAYAMIRLSDVFHVTLDWIYKGDPSGLPYGLATKILGPQFTPYDPKSDDQKSA